LDWIAEFVSECTKGNGGLSAWSDIAHPSFMAAGARFLIAEKCCPSGCAVGNFYERSSNDGEEMSRKTDLGLERHQVEGSP
jgi:hypothetical protein